jgi:5-oxoprolinase (ATP-hydrolysing) subunit A
MEVDLNCDLGEGCALDEELMALVTSVNIACGFHAGDPSTARTALCQALAHGVQAGAHPSFPDRANFGRAELSRTAQQVFDDCVYQVGALAGLAKAVGLRLRHLKPHGALYNQACREAAYARPVVDAAALFGLCLVGLPGSQLQTLSAGRCSFAPEGFADRRYLPDGSLVPRSAPNAFIEDPTEAVQQVNWLLRERGVRTICVHGDNPRALDFVRLLRADLLQAGHRISPFNP